jgi:hypothetical protein
MKYVVNWARMSMGGMRSLLAAGLLLAGAAVTQATVIPVGTGANKANVQVEFGDGAGYTFEVSFDGSKTGMGLLDIIEANTSLTAVRNDFGWGVFVDGFIYDGHSNVGWGGGENWWHYWVRESGQNAWESPSYGAVTRAATDGSWDGWVYGRASAPTPEPATALLFGLMGVFVMCRSRSVK